MTPEQERQVHESQVFTIRRRTVGGWMYGSMIVILILVSMSQCTVTSKVSRQRDEMQRKAEFWNWAVEHTSTGVIIVNADSGKIEVWNPAAERMLGWAQHEMKGVLIWSLMPEEFRLSHDKYAGNRLVREQLAIKSIRVKCWMKTKQGINKEVEIEVHGVPSYPYVAASASDFKFLVSLSEPQRVIELPDQLPPANEPLESGFKGLSPPLQIPKSAPPAPPAP